jgi:phosphate transport system protein
MERHFDTELADLKQDILTMGSMVEGAIANSIDVLKNLDKMRARKVIDFDRYIDIMEIKINNSCLTLLALRQPLAFDLRFITMAMGITIDLERMADLAVDIAQRAEEIADEPLLKPLIDIPALASLAQAMIKRSLDSFIGSDPDMAMSVILLDNEADRLRNSVQKELVNSYMMKDKSTIRRALALLLAARHLERICDHATNIAEDVIYLTKAKMIKHRAEKLAGDD